MATLPTVQTVDYKNVYDEAIAKQKQQAQKAYEQVVAAAQRQQENTRQQHDELRAKALATARLDALASQEEMAAKGLAGRASAASKSGADETRRVMQNTALQNQIGQIGRQENQQLQAQNDKVQQARLEREASTAEYEQTARLEQAKAQESQNQAQLQAYKAMQAAEEFKTKMAQTKAEAAVDKALQELKLFGKVMTKASAQALGIKVGTTSMEYNRLKKTRKI